MAFFFSFRQNSIRFVKTSCCAERTENSKPPDLVVSSGVPDKPWPSGMSCPQLSKFFDSFTSCQLIYLSNEVILCPKTKKSVVFIFQFISMHIPFLLLGHNKQ